VNELVDRNDIKKERLYAYTWGCSVCGKLICDLNPNVVVNNARIHELKCLGHSNGKVNSR